MENCTNLIMCTFQQVSLEDKIVEDKMDATYYNGEQKIHTDV
jgi:hypothetical protein